jgi:hypothetical protein
MDIPRGLLCAGIVKRLDFDIRNATIRLQLALIESDFPPSFFEADHARSNIAYSLLLRLYLSPLSSLLSSPFFSPTLFGSFELPFSRSRLAPISLRALRVPPETPAPVSTSTFRATKKLCHSTVPPVPS